MHLSREVLRQLVVEKGIVTNYSDLDKQLTANGIDIRIAGIVEVLDAGKLAIEKPNNIPPKLGKAIVLKGYEERFEGYDVKELQVVDEGTIKFEKLRPYLIVTCEKVNTPSNLMIHAGPRSSLFRLTQSLLGATFTEAGYNGFMTFMLIPFLNGQLELGTRIAQLSFSELKGEAHYEDQKESSYQGGRIF